MNKQEEKFVKTFIKPNRRERYLIQLASKKRRDTFTPVLAHNFEFIPEYAIKIPPSKQSTKLIEILLNDKGAKENCHIISENKEIDGKDIPLNKALSEVVGYNMGTILICIPEKLAYYESEDIGERYILFKGR